MPLIECPDCGRKVSDRAATCPECACPVAEVVSEQRAADERARVATTRAITEDAVDCPKCEARGFFSGDEGTFIWCVACEHTGRLLLGTADDGYYGVARYAVERFLAGEIHPGESGVVFFLDVKKPDGHRFPKASPRSEIDPKDIPW